MTPDPSDDSSVRVRIRGRELSLAMTEEQAAPAEGLAHTVSARALHHTGPWTELAFFLLGAAWPGSGWSSSP